MSGDFKWRHFQGEIILWAVRWYCKYGMSYRELEDMLSERGVPVDHTTLYRWVQRYAPEIEKRLRWAWRHAGWQRRWHVDETYIKVKGQWAYLYRAVDSEGHTLDFFLSPRRNTAAATRFLRKVLKGFHAWEKPAILHTDQAAAYGKAIAALKRDGTCPMDTEHRQIKYKNNVIEADHGRLKRVIKPTLGFKSMKTARATLQGFEVMHALRKGQAKTWSLYPGVKGEVRLIERAFGLGLPIMAEMVQYVETELLARQAA